MSGPKTAYIRPNYRQLLKQLCAETSRWLRALPSLPTVAELEQELAQARRDARKFRADTKAQSSAQEFLSLLDKMDQHREDLSLLLKKEQSALRAAESAMHALRQELASSQALVTGSHPPVELTRTASTSLVKARKRAQESSEGLWGAMSRLQQHRREMRLWQQVVEQKLEGAKDGADPAVPKDNLNSEAIKQQIAKEAALAQLQDRLAAISKEPSKGWNEVQKWLPGSARVDDVHQLAEQAKTRLAEGKLEVAQQALDSAEKLRANVVEEAARNKEAFERNQQIAEAIMQALCDRHYNAPAYGPLKEREPLSGLQIRADVPNMDGKGNIRVDIHLDGSTVLEVENVPEGEEGICRNVIEGIAKSLAQEGMELEVKSWGRASKQADDRTHPARTTSKERERQPERTVNPDSHE